VTRAPRKDAVANRARVIAAATEVFRREGFGVGVNQIAREAGINVATLYRNFPSKTELILAIGASLIEPLATARDEVLAADEPDAVGRFLVADIAIYRDNRGVSDMLGSLDLAPEVRRQLHALARDVLAPLADRGHEDGSLAPRFDVTDLLVALRMLHAAIASSAHHGRDPLAYVDVLRAGLRP
jgi:AcrR family transcriptional regulator